MWPLGSLLKGVLYSIREVDRKVGDWPTDRVGAYASKNNWNQMSNCHKKETIGLLRILGILPALSLNSCPVIMIRVFCPAAALQLLKSFETDVSVSPCQWQCLPAPTPLTPPSVRWWRKHSAAKELVFTEYGRVSGDSTLSNLLIHLLPLGLLLLLLEAVRGCSLALHQVLLSCIYQLEHMLTNHQS